MRALSCIPLLALTSTAADSVSIVMDGDRVKIFITVDAKVDKAQAVVDAAKAGADKAAIAKKFQQDVLTKAYNAINRVLQANNNTDAQIDAAITKANDQAKAVAEEAAEIKRLRPKKNLDPFEEEKPIEGPKEEPAVEVVPDATDRPKTRKELYHHGNTSANQ